MSIELVALALLAVDGKRQPDCSSLPTRFFPGMKTNSSGEPAFLQSCRKQKGNIHIEAEFSLLCPYLLVFSESCRRGRMFAKRLRGVAGSCWHWKQEEAVSQRGLGLVGVSRGYT